MIRPYFLIIKSDFLVVFIFNKSDSPRREILNKKLILRQIFTRQVVLLTQVFHVLYRVPSRLKENTYTTTAKRVSDGLGFHAMLRTAPSHCKVLRHRPVHTSQNFTNLSSPPAVDELETMF